MNQNHHIYNGKLDKVWVWECGCGCGTTTLMNTIFNAVYLVNKTLNCKKKKKLTKKILQLFVLEYTEAPQGW